MEVCSGAFVEPVLRVNKFFAAGTSPRTKRRVLEERVVENGEEKGLEMKRIKLQEVDYSNTTTFAPVPVRQLQASPWPALVDSFTHDVCAFLCIVLRCARSSRVLQPRSHFFLRVMHSSAHASAAWKERSAR